MYHCRLCGATLRHVFLDLGMSPLANSLISEKDKTEPEIWYPLCVYTCSECLMVQLPEIAKAKDIFGTEYLYFSSYSKAWVENARIYAEKMIQRFGLNSDSLVVELGSNDGYLLQHFKAHGIPVLGVDPAPNVSAVAMEQGIPTLPEFFGCALAAKLDKASLIHGVNVFAHVPDLHDFVQGIKLLLADNGIVTLEFPHLMRLIEFAQFDTIYHEHFSYFTLFTASAILAEHGLEVFDVEELPTHGGSIRVYASHQGAFPVAPSVKTLWGEEKKRGLHSIDGYFDFSEKVEELKLQLLDFLISVKQTGSLVAGFGAPAKGNTLLNYCGIRPDLLEFTVEDSPHKQGRLLPGSRIPVLPTSMLFSARPDYVLILPWNLAQEISAKLQPLRENSGTRLVIPIPEVQVL